MQPRFLCYKNNNNNTNFWHRVLHKHGYVIICCERLAPGSLLALRSRNKKQSSSEHCVPSGAAWARHIGKDDDRASLAAIMTLRLSQRAPINHFDESGVGNLCALDGRCWIPAGTLHQVTGACERDSSSGDGLASGDALRIRGMVLTSNR